MTDTVTSTCQRHLMVAMAIIVVVALTTTLPYHAQAYKVNLPRPSRPHGIQTRLSEHKKETTTTHEDTYALRRPPKKRSSASKVAMTSAVIDHTTTMPTFESRMRQIMLRDERKNKPRTAATAATRKHLPNNVSLISSLEEYKKVVGEEREKIVVARFFAPWCKACKAIQPMYYRLASKFTNVVFVEVPVTEANANLHQGLGVPSLPYAHVYEPSTGLVEELKISRKHISEFANKLQSYVAGICELKDMSTISPYRSSQEEQEADDNDAADEE